eukprot:CAMPEP_0172830524 /NCGR_PEP_ID=MMETSP1075-20121228/22316_1 /TAXON_ID=2916 /ORGANISM="Ceratium fusus, Strain PA161109" /LENGTH=448 /DNA_ID=CAMNT_0013672837 /DNA_START=1 /DNA_END=1343 /DNA_ORIENTATION=+
MASTFCAPVLPSLLFFLPALALANQKAPNTGIYALVADAGSTGTRMYLFHMSFSSDDTQGDVKIVDVGKGPALSSFQDSPKRASEAVASQLIKAKDQIPETFHKSVTVSVFATAGMRLLPVNVADAIYDGLKTGLLTADFPFNAGKLQARTISGREEGIFALIAANYLAKTIHASLHGAGNALMGVLDLGGSSTQVAAPPSLGAGELLSHKLGSDHTFVRSFLKLGMERMRSRTFQSFVDAAPVTVRERRAVPNPCAFYGYSEGEEKWRGVGHASSCEQALVELLAQDKAECTASHNNASDANGSSTVTDCLGGGPVLTPSGPKSSARFFLISGFLYVTDFARWWLEQPGVRTKSLTVLSEPGAFSSPTVAELREVAHVLCAASWGDIADAANNEAVAHRFTKQPKVPHRCFELNYIIALLSEGYGFGPHERIFRIVEDVGGGEIEWT